MSDDEMDYADFPDDAFASEDDAPAPPPPRRNNPPPPRNPELPPDPLSSLLGARGGPMGGLATGLGNMFGGPGGGGGGAGWGGHPHARAPARAFNQAYTAYSTALLEAQEGRDIGGGFGGAAGGGRANVMYGGKIVMPPSALQILTELDLESPWMFEIHNPRKPELVTHAGVLEFIAQEGSVHFPQWMMERLEMVEGDPVRLIGARLPKGKLVKIQAQSVDFLELSDPKAVLEQAFRNFAALTPGDIVEISYNCLLFKILVVSIEPPDAPGISVIDTDLEVDFEAPKGYVPPPIPTREPRSTGMDETATMRNKLKINLNEKQDVDEKGRGSGVNTPDGLGGGGGGGKGKGKEKEGQSSTSSGGAENWQIFGGSGNTLGGKRIKGKGVKGKKIEDVAPNSRIMRTNQPRIVTADTQIGGRQVPAALNLPDGVLFFGWNRSAKDAAAAAADQANKDKSSKVAFGDAGSGQTLSGRPAPQPQPQSSSSSFGVEQSSSSAMDTSTSSSSDPPPPPKETKPFSGEGHSLR